MNLEDFNKVMKKVLDNYKTTNDRTYLKRLQSELIEAYLQIDEECAKDPLFNINVVSRFKYVLNLVEKRSIDVLFKNFNS